MLDAIVSFQFMYHHVILKIHSFIFSWFFDLFNFTSHLVQFQYLISSFCHHFSFPFLGRHIFVLFSASTHFGHRTGYFFSALCREDYFVKTLIVLISVFCKTFLSFLIVASKNLRFLGGSLGLLE